MITYTIQVSDAVGAMLEKKAAKLGAATAEEYLDKHVRKLATEQKTEDATVIPQTEVAVTKKVTA